MTNPIKTFFISLLLLSGIAMAEPFDFSITLSTRTVKMPEWLLASDGIDLAYYSFIPDNPKAVIIFNHGSGSWSCGMYQAMAQDLADDHCIATYLIDRRGHGNSQGPRGDAPSEQQVWQDIDTVIDFVKAAHPTLPILLAGHSSGAGLILNYTIWPQRTNTVDGYLFLAPFLGTQSGALHAHKNPNKRFIKHARAWAFIAYGISKGALCAHTPALFFNYPNWVKKQDKHILSYYTCAMASCDSPQNPRHIFEALDKPFALYVGQEEELFIAPAVTAYAACSKQQSIAEIVPHAKHLSIVADAPKLFADALDKLAFTTRTKE